MDEGRAMKLDFDPTPDALVIGGKFQFGTYGRPIAKINPLEALPAAARWLYAFRLKEWQAFQAADAEYFVLGAVYATKLLDLLQVAVIEKKSGMLHKWEQKVAPMRLKLAQGLDGTTSSGDAGGLSVTFLNDLGHDKLGIRAAGNARADLPDMEVQLDGSCAPQDAAHVVICHPFSETRALYSNKCMMPVTGHLRMGSTHHSLADGQGVLILDDHKGFYPSPMVYDWLTAAARDASGRILGFNLTANQIRDPERYNENALWVGATVERLPAVRFERPRGVNATWYVKDRDGRVDVRFSPTVRNEVHAGPGRCLAEYYGPFGWVEGTITRDDGEVVRVDGLFGMGEKKKIRL